MGEDAVQDDAHPQGVSRAAEGAEVRLGAEHGVHLLVVRRVIAVVGPGLDDGVQVEHIDAPGAQLRQLPPDASEIAAEKVAVRDLALGVGPPVRLLAPGVVDAVGLQLAREVAGSGAVKPVGEDLVEHRALRPVRRRRLRGDGAHLPAVTRLHVRVAPALAEETEAAVFLENAEIVEIKASRQADLAGKVLVIAQAAAVLQGEFQRLAGACVLEQYCGAPRPDGTGHVHPQTAGRVLPQDAEGVLIDGQPGIVENAHQPWSLR